MELIMQALDFFLHLDKHLADLIANYGTLTYVILFLIIFVETGVVIMPFLPGDSLLFAAGMFAAKGSFNIAFLCVLLFIAAFLGDFINYFIGKFFGEKILTVKLFGKQLVKAEHMDKTHEFYEKHGPKTIIIARFVPIVRTLAPFVAGIGKMNYKTFISYNIIGGAVWVLSLLFAGYFLGGYDIIKNNFEKVILGIIFISVVPIIVELIRGKK
jgi:membrane-associated protein